MDANLAKLQRKLRDGSALETGERGSNRVSALAEELFAGGSSTGLGSSRSKIDITDDSSARSSEMTGQSRKKSSIGKNIKTPVKKSKNTCQEIKNPFQKMSN